MRWFSDLFKVGRRGLYEFEGTGSGLLNKEVEYHGYIELEELEQHNDLSRVRIVKVTGAPADMVKRTMPEWIKTSEIDWLEDSKDA